MGEEVEAAKSEGKKLFLTMKGLLRMLLSLRIFVQNNEISQILYGQFASPTEQNVCNLAVVTLTNPGH